MRVFSSRSLAVLVFAFPLLRWGMQDAQRLHAQEEVAAPQQSVRATILLSEQPRGVAPEEVNTCTDLHERVTLALTAPAGTSLEEAQAAYERITQKARPSIPVDERVLTLFTKNGDAGRICGAGCGLVEFSASCVRTSLQALEDCPQQGNILGCEVHYDCSVACAPLPPEHAAAEEPEKPSWFGPLFQAFDRLVEKEEEEVDPIIPVSEVLPEGGAGGGGEGAAPESTAPEEPAPPEEEKQRYAAPEVPVVDVVPQPEPASPPEPLLLPPPEPKEEQLVQPSPEVKGAPSVPLEYEEWKRRWDEYWERWGRGEENLGPPPELPPWQENIHSSQPPECTVCAQYWRENPTAGSTTKPPECIVCEQYWQNLYSH